MEIPSSQTALQAAAASGHLDVVKPLVDNGADVNTAGPAGTALHASAEAGHIDVVKLLLDNGADIDAGSTTNYGTALRAAASGGYIDVVKTLLDRDADVEGAAAPSPFTSGTALQAAVEGGHLDVLKMLLDHGAAVNNALPKARRRHYKKQLNPDILISQSCCSIMAPTLMPFRRGKIGLRCNGPPDRAISTW